MYRKATIPLDGSELAESVLPHLGAFVERFNLSDVTFIRVVDSERHCFAESCAEASALARRQLALRTSAEEYLARIVSRVSHDGTRFHAEVIVGTIPESLIDFVKQSGADLVLMATHGYVARTRWFRPSVTKKILRSVEVPVFAMEKDYRINALKTGPFFLLRFSSAHGSQLFHSPDGPRVNLLEDQSGNDCEQFKNRVRSWATAACEYRAGS
jgi:nucleotide-binding universal stress UspA family protein